MEFVNSAGYPNLMRKFSALIIILACSLIPVPAHAVTYKLTINYDLDLYDAFAESSADKFVGQLDSGESECSTFVTVAVIRQYDPDILDPLFYDRRYKVKNESGKVISSGKFKSKVSRPDGLESSICRVSVTVSLPKAKFYDVIDTEGTVLISGFPFSKFKKNVAKIDIWDWN